MSERDLIPLVLEKPSAVGQFSLQQWDLLIRQARHANLLGRIASVLAERNMYEKIPAQPRAHLEAALLVAERQKQAVQWEVNRIAQALKNLSVPIIFLKGSAYVISQLPTSNGRLFGDIDIMVPKQRLDDVEMALKQHGWITTHHDPYDQRYYRTWMHELPPMQHLSRKTLIDVHHTILPETARLRPDPVKLFEAAIPVDADGKLKTLAPIDMVLHSATHLFHDGELENGLRDLVDLDGLLRYFGSNHTDFWHNLVARAQELDLTRPLFYALRYTTRLLHTSVPPEVLDSAKIGAPNLISMQLMDVLFSRALSSGLPSRNDWLAHIAHRVLYVRSHWLRMPLHLLARHLFHKTFISPKDAPH